MLTRILPLAALGATAVSASAQTALLREGDLLASGPTMQTITGFNTPAINSVGGYAVVLSSTDGTTTLSQAWGSPVDGSAAPAIFLTESTVGPLMQTSWESLSFGISDAGELCYSSSGDGGPAGGFDSIWRDLTALAVEGDPIPTLPGLFWRFGSRPKALSDGTVVFVGGITDTSGGSTQSTALFRGDTVVLTNGDVVPGLPAPLTLLGSPVSFDFQYSRNGDHYLVECDIEGLGSTEDNAMVLSGAGLEIDGSLVREGTLVPVAAGGNGTENWDNFDLIAVLNDGQYLFTGDTDNMLTSADEFIVKNGQIIKREGEMVDGFVLAGSIEGATMNQSGEVAYIWDVDNAGSNVEVLVYEDSIVLMEGDEVDVDGDGMPDAGNTVDDFESGSQLTLADDGTLYFVVDVQTSGGLIEIFYVIEGDGAIGTPYCVAAANSTGSDASISAGGSTSILANNLQLFAQPVPASQNGIFFYGPDQALVPFGNGFRCVGGGGTGLGRLTVETASMGGILNHAVDNTMPPTPSTALTAGSTWNFQAWFRDPAGGGAFFNLSNGLEVTFQP